MDDPLDGGATGVWHASVWRETARPDAWVIRVTSTADVSSPASETAVCDTADQACALLREWLDRIMQ